MKRGDTAREYIKNVLEKEFGDDFIGVQDKKIYINVPDEGTDKVMFAITLTMPKTAPAKTTSTAFDWSESAPEAAAPALPTEITAEDEKKLQDLMEALGIKD